MSSVRVCAKAEGKEAVSPSSFVHSQSELAMTRVDPFKNSKLQIKMIGALRCLIRFCGAVDSVCLCMNEGGKKEREGLRFVFLVCI